MKATVGQFSKGYRITLSELSPVEVNRIRRVLEHAARGQAWDGGSTRTVAEEAANAISKALKVENGQFFMSGGEGLEAKPPLGSFEMGSYLTIPNSAFEQTLKDSLEGLPSPWK